MKRTNVSFLIFAFFTAIVFNGCKFNLTNTNYLDRPDVVIRPGCFEIIAPYISSNTESITIYRQNNDEGTIERVAIVFPKGIEDISDQTMHYDDHNVITATQYRYYLRFTDKNGVKNRTEWSEQKSISGGAEQKNQIAYTTTNIHYVYDAEKMFLTTSPLNAAFTAPDDSVIKDIAKYYPALVFECGTDIQVFELPHEGTTAADTTAVNLKALLPEEFLYKEIKLLGIVGQKTVYNSKNTDVLQCVSWTNLSPITVKDSIGTTLSTIKLEPEHGKAGFDYSTTSDNE